MTISKPEPSHDLPDSTSVVEALANPDLYEQLVQSSHTYADQQSPIASVFDGPWRSQSSSCGASTLCPAYEGQTRKINDREYRLYCINAPWGQYVWLPKSKTLLECEQKCHESKYDCNGLTFYPSTGACTAIYSKDSAPYIWDNGYQKIGAIPVKSDVAFSPGMLCPLPGSDNQVWDFADQKYRFKMSCRNQFRVDAKFRKGLGAVKNVDECGEKCGQQKDCYGFNYFQRSFPGGRVDGARECELITTEINDDDFVPMNKPFQYLSGLRVEVSTNLSSN
jgi:hypothetical protein